MRLTRSEQRIIRAKTNEIFGDDVELRLFGSRADDTARGGDIDLYVHVGHVLDNRAAAASRLAAELQMALGDQKIDVVVVDPETPPQPIHRAARAGGIAL